jgi:alpha-tubulin suppressor-like RCC1 family protein
MPFTRACCLTLVCLLSVLAQPAGAAVVNATWTIATDIPVTASSYTATGNTVNFTLNFAPATGTNLTVVNNTGLPFISGAFDNLAQGQAVALSYGGVTYNYVAHYYGGTGNELVLVWARNRALAWGSNNFGQVGDGTTTQRNVMVLVTATGVLAGKTIVALSQGGSYCLALCSDGTLAAWGYNGYGQLGNNTTTHSYVPVQVNTTSGVSALYGKTVVAIAAGANCSMALCSDGTVATWGGNDYGQLGNGSTTWSSVPVAVSTSGASALNGKTVVAIAAGGSVCMALRSDGTVVSWGYNYYGQLGNNSTTSSPIPVAVNTASGVSALYGKTVVALCASGSPSIVLCSDGTLASWGENIWGEVGDVTTTSRSVPVPVYAASSASALYGKSVVAMATGGQQTVALCSDGTLATWGYNGSGELGNGTTANNSMPGLVNRASGTSSLFGKSVVAVAASGANTRVLCSDGTLSIWGNGISGGLGNNTTSSSSVPVTVSYSPLGSDEPVVNPASSANTAVSVVLVAEPAPSLTTMAAGTIGSTTAVLRGSVNPNGGSASVSFDYGTSTAYGSSVAATPASVTGSTDTTVSAAVTGLSPLTTYHFRSVLPGSLGADQSFTTLNNDASLASLTTGAGVLSPVFASGVTNYSMSLPTEADSLVVAPSVTDANASVQVNGVSMVPGGSTTVGLGYGINLIQVKVTAQDGAATRTYVIAVTRAPSAVLGVGYASASDVPLTIENFTATGRTVNFALNFAPQTGANLTVVNNTGLPFISGTFDNLAQGQAVSLSYNGVTYNYVANYYGGTGNDLVLVWAANRAFGWGSNSAGMIGDGTATERDLMVPVTNTGVLAGKTIVSLVQGDAHSMALCSDGTVASWGDNGYGQLGTNNTTGSRVPVAVNTASGVSALYGKTVVAIAAGSYHSLALCSDGTVVAWGYNFYGQLGSNISAFQLAAPVAVSTASGVSALYGKTVVAVAGGYLHSLAVCSDGTVVAWGYNLYGQLGNNSTTNSSAPVAVSTDSGVSALYGKTAVTLAAGTFHSVALCSDGTIATWGYNGSGQLGDNTTTQRLVPVAVSTASGTSALFGRSVTAIASGDLHNLALCADGGVVAWGYNSYGQLGNNNTGQFSAPVAVNTSSGVSALSGKTVVAIAVGGANDCTSRAMCSDGTVVIWGDNTFGSLGNGGGGNSNVPVLVDTSPLTAGEKPVSPLNRCTAEATLILVAEPPPAVTTLTATSLTGSTAMLNGLVSTYASTVNVSFDYGITTAYGSSSTATPASVSGNVPTAVSAALTGLLPLTTYHFRVNDGAYVGSDLIFTTPNNDASLSSLGLSAGSLTPAFASGTLNYMATVDTATSTVSVTPTLSDSNATLKLNGVSISSGSVNPVNLGYGDNVIHVVVTSQDGVVSRDYVLHVQRTPPTTVNATYASAADVPLVTSGFTATGGTLNLSLSYAPATGTNLMVVNNSGLNFISGTFDNLVQGQTVALSYNGVTYHYVANYYGGTGNDLVLAWQNSRLYAWGSNTYGEIGDGTMTNRTQPVAVTSSGVLAGKTIVSLVAGLSHTLVLCSDGTLAAWGDNQSGQLGDSTTTSRSTPVLVSLEAGVSALHGRTVVAIAAGGYHSLALCTDGTLVTWGDNSWGQLGDNTTTFRRAPVAVNTANGVSALYGRSVVAMVGGWYFNLALCSDGTVVTWGENNQGQLGNSTTTASNVPVLVTVAGGVLEGKTVSTLSAGAAHCAVLCSDGSLAAWGYNLNGQLGNNSATSSSVPVVVNAASGTSALYGKTVASLSAGSYHCLALCTDGAAVAWGANYKGQLGDNTTTQRNAPVLVNAGSGVSALYGRTVTALVGEDTSSLALCSDGSLVAWGENAVGQIGDGTTTNRSVPVLVLNTQAAGERVSALSRMAFSDHSLALVAAPPYPTATTQPATLIAGTSVVLNGTFVAAYSSLAAGFEYGATTAYGTQVAGVPTLLTDGAAIPVSAAVTGLTPGTTYHFRASGTNGAGMLTGSDLTFTTLNNNPALGSLTLGGGALSPAFDPATTDYTVSVPYVTSSVTLAPALADTHASMLLNGVSFSSGAVSWPVQLLEGSNVITIVVTAEDGVTIRTYTVTVTRAAGPSLVSLNLSEGALNPIFDGNTMSYTAAVPQATNSITLIPTVADGTSTVAINGAAVISGGISSPVSLQYGDNAISVVVTAQDGSTTKAYVVNVTRAIPSDFSVSFASANAVPLAMNGVTATGTTLNLALNYAPVTGTNLTVVKNTSNSPINGAFNNLAQGQTVGLGFGSVTYNYVVNYFGGTGNDLVLQWATNHVYAWGYDQVGQLGTQLSGNNNYYPYPVGFGTDIGALTGKTVVSLAAGGGHTLALCSDGTVAGWGDNSAGQVGYASSSGTVYAPVAVSVAGSSALNGKTVVAIAAGSIHSLALCSDGTVVGWGNNGSGQLGTGSSTTYISSGDYRPVAVSVLSGSSALDGKRVVAIAAGAYHSLALCSDGTVVAWGANDSGQLGDTTTTQRNFPVVVNAVCGVSALYGRTVTAVAAGGYHSLALCSDGTVVAWGRNANGQLGDKTLSQRSMPVPVSTTSGLSALFGKTVVMIAAGGTHSLALCSDGSIAAWGNNSGTQLGEGSNVQRQWPVAVSTSSGFSILFGKTVTSIAAGIGHSLALCSDGTLAAWGGPFTSGTLGTGYSFPPPRTIKGPAACKRDYLSSTGVFAAAFSGESALHSLAFVADPPPAVLTLPANNITSYSAAANGSTDSSLISSVYFEYGLTTAYGSQSWAYPTGNNGNTLLITAYLSGLQPATTYHYRVATSTYKAADQTFTTLSLLQGWRQQSFGTSANTGASADAADYDNDGIPNLVEWACNLSPTARSVLPAAVATNGANFEYTYSRSTAAVTAGSTFTVEWSNTLVAGSWSSSGVVQTVLSDDGTTQQVKAVIPINAATAKFVHLSVTAPP